MNLHWIKYLIVGVILTGIIILSAIALFNAIVYKIPVFGPDKPSTFPELNTYSRPIQFTDIAIDDPVRKNLLTEDQAWEYTWAFLHDRIGFKIFLPMEKRTAGLRQIVDDKGNQYLVWDFYARQGERPFFLYQKFILGGNIYIDAHDGHVLWYYAFL
jgi:hypothetical protein